jgi:hypothetical protein
MHRRLAAGLTGLLLPFLVPATALAAGPVAHEVWRGAESFSHFDCTTADGDPFEITGDVRFHGNSIIRAARTGEISAPQAFLLHDGWHIRDTQTVVASGKTFSINENGLFKEMSAEHLPDYPVYDDEDVLIDTLDHVYRFTTREVVSLVVRYGNGRLAYRGNAVYQHVAVFDTLGDSEPGGTLLSLDTTLVAGTDVWAAFDYCGLARSLLTPA